MKTHRIQLKLYAEAGTLGEPERFVPVFHGWIRDRVLDEVLIDVARYTHVHEGPAVILVGHHSDFSIDLAEARPGLLVTRKRDSATDSARLGDLFRVAFEAASRLESDPVLSGLHFRTDDLRLTILDRLHAPNDAATFEQLEPEIRSFVHELLGADAALAREGSGREALGVRIRRANSEPVSEIARRANGC